MDAVGGVANLANALFIELWNYRQWLLNGSLPTKPLREPISQGERAVKVRKHVFSSHIMPSSSMPVRRCGDPSIHPGG